MQTLAMPDLPYTCQIKRDSCPRCATKGLPGDGDSSVISTTSSVSGSVPWSIDLSGVPNLRSFLIGSFSAAADVFGTIHATPDDSMWPSTEVNYVFHDACDAFGCTEVPAFPSGTTGIVDLGPVDIATKAGSFWSSSLTFRFTVPTADIITSCSIGY